MSDTNETPDTVETSETSFAQDLIKTVTLNAAATAGTLVGLAAIGFGVEKVREFRANRAAKKDADIVNPTEA